VRPTASTKNYALHCKPVPYLDKQAVLNLPWQDKSIRDELERLFEWTTDAKRYECSATDQLDRAILSTEHINLQLKRGKIKLQHNHRGTCKPFKVPEHPKSRWRVIQQPKRANKMTAKDAKVKFTPFYERHSAVLKGKYAIDLDWSAFFDQFELSDDVSEFFSFRAADGRVFSMKVLPMGLKHSVSVAHTTTLQLLNFGATCYMEAYIDNVRLISDDKEALLRDAATLLARCAAAGVTVNEADASQLMKLPEEKRHAAAVKLVAPLCTSKAAWLGELYDYANKTVEMTDKTREKVAKCLDAPRPSFRSFAGVAGILQYASRTLGLQLAKYHAARRAISDVAWLLETCDHLWDAEMPPMCPSVIASFRQWRRDVLEAPARHITEPVNPELVIIVDASDTGWGALSFDEHGRETFRAAQWDTADKRAFNTKVSTRAEPEGLYRACCMLVRKGVHKNVYIASDSSAAVGAVNRGHSSSYWMNYVCSKLQAAFPDVTFHVVHTPGRTNPADGISRGAPEPSSEDWAEARAIADEAKATRISGLHH
jgi:hypothetical protein